MGQKIYHLHIRKTGGRSVHNAVFGQTGYSPKYVYEFLAKNPGGIVDAGPLRIGAWVSDLGRRFDYSFSHKPFYHVQNIGDDAFLFCCLRDPVQRLLSLWKTLKTYIDTQPTRAQVHEGLEQEKQYFDDDYVRFFEKLPAFHGMNQLYMFSETGDLTEAVVRLNRMNLILETEDLGAGIRRLSEIHGWTVDKVPHVGAASIAADITPAVETQLRQLMYKEYVFLEVARGMRTHYTRR